ncbi:cache domain-containing protein [Nitrosophilus labii]|uniref:cache domain-containing protein n=1 Tax=Nitrosophilus labii TaxID=2706014 RepID=UPI0016573E5E|nr:cache domain-containing protein [Nitrosophilus labii]
MRKKLFLASIILFVLSTLISIVIFNLYKKREIAIMNHAYDNINRLIILSLVSEKSQSLSLALALSKNKAIAEAILNNDPKKCSKILKETTDSLLKHLNRKNIYVQVIDTNLKVFAISWKDTFYKTYSLKDRDDLKLVLKKRVPKYTIATTLPAGIKISAPIIYNEKSIGILEVTIPFDDLAIKFRGYGMELLPLFKKAYLDKKDFIFNNLNINQYIVANKNFNLQTVKILKNLNNEDFEKLEHFDYIKTKNLFIASYPIKDHKGRNLGMFVVFLNNKSLKNIAGEQKSILKSIFTLESTKEDIYHYVNHFEKNIFSDMSPKYIINFKNSIDEKDRIYFNEAAKERLQKMSKKELIDLILYGYNQTQTKKEGKIK